MFTPLCIELDRNLLENASFRRVGFGDILFILFIQHFFGVSNKILVSSEILRLKKTSFATIEFKALFTCNKGLNIFNGLNTLQIYTLLI